jgi:hypothetical protein
LRFRANEVHRISQESFVDEAILEGFWRSARPPHFFGSLPDVMFDLRHPLTVLASQPPRDQIESTLPKKEPAAGPRKRINEEVRRGRQLDRRCHGQLKAGESRE